MADDMSTIVAALIGAVIGSIGSAAVTNLLSSRTEKKRSYENLVQRYLLQLQDSIESIWYRFLNIKQRGGRMIMENVYYETTTLYALAKVLAIKHILITEGIYSNIENIKPGLGIDLRDKLEAFDKRLDQINFELDNPTRFYRYDRQLLAETVLEKEEQYLRVSTFLNFRKQYDDSSSSIRTLLAPTKEFVLQLDGSNISEIMKDLSTIAERLSEETGIRTSVTSTPLKDYEKLVSKEEK